MVTRRLLNSSPSLLLNLEAQGEGLKWISSFAGDGDYQRLSNLGILCSLGKDGSFLQSAEETITMDGDTDLVAIFANKYRNVGATEGGTYEILDESGLIASSTAMDLPTPFVHRYTTDSTVDSTTSGLSMLGNESFAQTTFIPTADVNYTAIFSSLAINLILHRLRDIAFTDSGIIQHYTVTIQVQVRFCF